MSLIKDVKNILISRGFTSVEMFLSYLPDQDNAIGLFQTGGRAETTLGIAEPTFQVRLRHEDYEIGIKLLEDIKKALIELGDLVQEPNRYLSFYAESDVMELGRDEQERFNFSLNFRAYVERDFFGYPLHLKEAQEAVVQAETTRLQEDIDVAKAKIADLPQDKSEVIDLVNRITFLEEYMARLNEAIHLTEVAEASKIQSDHDNAKALVDSLEVESDRKPLQDRLAVVQAYIRESTRICIDFGSSTYQSPSPWNNIISYSKYTKINNLIAMAGNETPYSIEITDAFSGINTAYGVVQDGIYFVNVVRDSLKVSWGGYGQAKIAGLDPSKFYRITCFGSVALDNVISEYLIGQTSDYFVNQTITLDCSYNLDKTVSKTIQPNSNGEIYVSVGNYNQTGTAYLNALEIQQM